MRIRMKSTAAGPNGTWQGDCECPDVQARQFIAAGYAVALDSVETTMLSPATEMRHDPILPFGKYKGKTVSEVFAENPKYVRDFLAVNEDAEIAAAAKAVSA
jgi:hypothetical protein